MLLEQLKHRRPSASLAVSLLALFVALGGTTYAATGGNFILGQANDSTSQTSLSAPVANKALQVTNSSTAAGAGGIGVNVASGKPPFVISAGAGKATNLNSDKLDGKDSTAFLLTTDKAADSDRLDGIDSTGFYAAGSKVADSDTLDGIDSTGFYAAGSKVADSDKLDGLDSTQLVTGGGHLIANRLAGATNGQLLLNIPFMGQLIVDGCDGINGRLRFDTAGTGNVDYMHSALYTGSSPELGTLIGSNISTATRPSAFITMNIARDAGPSTKIVTIWASWDANGCRFQAQALESPQL
jgi:hypothetical protein